MILVQVQHRRQRTVSLVHRLRYPSPAAFTSPISWTVTVSLVPPSPVITPHRPDQSLAGRGPRPCPPRCHSDVFEITVMTLESVWLSGGQRLYDARTFPLLMKLAPGSTLCYWISRYVVRETQRRRKQTFGLHFEGLLPRLLLGFRSSLSPSVRSGFIAQRPVVYSTKGMES